MFLESSFGAHDSCRCPCPLLRSDRPPSADQDRKKTAEMNEGRTVIDDVPRQVKVTLEERGRSRARDSGLGPQDGSQDSGSGWIPETGPWILSRLSSPESCILASALPGGPDELFHLLDDLVETEVRGVDDVGIFPR